MNGRLILTQQLRGRRGYEDTSCGTYCHDCMDYMCHAGPYADATAIEAHEREFHTKGALRKCSTGRRTST